MQIRNGKPPRSGRLARVGVEISREARVRLAWMDFYRRFHNVARTCRHFGICRQTFHRWQKRYDPIDLRSWRSAVIVLTTAGSRLGLFTFAISTSRLGRILTSLKRQGRLVEPPRTGVAGSRRALRPRPMR